MLLLQLLEPRQQECFAPNVDTKRQQVYERADHGFDARKIRGTTGNYHSEHDVRFAAVVAQDQAPYSLQNSIWCQLVTAREVLQLESQSLGQVESLAVGAWLRCVALAPAWLGNGRRLGNSLEPFRPEEFGVLQVLLL